jgi:hypothetical protein
VVAEQAVLLLAAQGQTEPLIPAAVVVVVTVTVREQVVPVEKVSYLYGSHFRNQF